MAANNSSSGRNNTGTTNIFAGQNNAPSVSATGLLGQGYSNQRPSSAGHSRPSGGSSGNGSSHLNTGNPVPLSHLLGAHPYPTAGGGGIVNNNPMLNISSQQQGSSNGGSSSGRPKSASAARRTNEPSAQQQQQQINLANIYGVGGSNLTAQQIYAMQQQAAQQQAYKLQQQAQAPAQQMAEQQAQQHGSYHYNTVGSTQQPSARPLSANATSHTNAHAGGAGTAGYTDHWSNSYKLHYAYNQQQAAVPNGTSNSGGVKVNTQLVNNNTGNNGNMQYANSAENRPNSAIAVVKLRTAVDLSHKYDGAAAPLAVQQGQNISGSQPVVQLAGLDNDDDEGEAGLDGLAANHAKNHATGICSWHIM